MVFRRLVTSALLLYVILGSWKGYVALFEEEAAEPRQIFPCKVASLPLSDQQALENGIVIRNSRDLNRLLEDFLS